MPEPLEIVAQATPNPNAAKFTINRVVAGQGTTYRQPASEAGEAGRAEPEWVRQLLGIAGVTQVFALQQFVTVTKTAETDWGVIGPQVEQVLRRAFT